MKSRCRRVYHVEEVHWLNDCNIRGTVVEEFLVESFRLLGSFVRNHQTHTPHHTHSFSISVWSSGVHSAGGPARGSDLRNNKKPSRKQLSRTASCR
ncbi:hypothetical protein R6Q59_031467 [Mikania micrantha]